VIIYFEYGGSMSLEPHPNTYQTTRHHISEDRNIHFNVAFTSTPTLSKWRFTCRLSNLIVGEQGVEEYTYLDRREMK
jgi:hypothetical protein